MNVDKHYRLSTVSCENVCVLVQYVEATEDYWGIVVLACFNCIC